MTDNRSEHFALTWHDLACPQGEQCPGREQHALSDPMVRSGVVEKFAARIQKDTREQTRLVEQGYARVIDGHWDS